MKTTTTRPVQMKIKTQQGVRNNMVAEIRTLPVSGLMQDLKKIPECPPGIIDYLETVASFNQRGKTDIVIGGVAYDWKAAYLWFFPGKDTMVLPDTTVLNIGHFARYDNVTSILRVNSSAYLPNTRSLMMFSRILGSAKIDYDTDNMGERLQRLNESINTNKAYLLACVKKSMTVGITPEEAYMWTRQWFHTAKYARIVSMMFNVQTRGSGNVWNLVSTISKYYARRARTPQMQWWNINMAEKLLVNPVGETSRAQAWTQLADKEVALANAT